MRIEKDTKRLELLNERRKELGQIISNLYEIDCIYENETLETKINAAFSDIRRVKRMLDYDGEICEESQEKFQELYESNPDGLWDSLLVISRGLRIAYKIELMSIEDNEEYEFAHVTKNIEANTKFICQFCIDNIRKTTRDKKKELFSEYIENYMADDIGIDNKGNEYIINFDDDDDDDDIDDDDCDCFCDEANLNVTLIADLVDAYFKKFKNEFKGNRRDLIKEIAEVSLTDAILRKSLPKEITSSIPKEIVIAHAIIRKYVNHDNKKIANNLSDIMKKEVSSRMRGILKNYKK